MYRTGKGRKVQLCLVIRQLKLTDVGITKNNNKKEKEKKKKQREKERRKENER